MKTKITLILMFIIGLISCSNQAEEKKVSVSKVEPYVNHDSTRFTIVGKQDTTQNGESIIKYPNGNFKMHGMMKDGKREGLWKSFYENGLQWSETTFEAGIKNGKTTTWYENGKKRYEGFYKNDVESGKWIYWNEKGEEVARKDNDLPAGAK